MTEGVAEIFFFSTYPPPSHTVLVQSPVLRAKILIICPDTYVPRCPPIGSSLQKIIDTETLITLHYIITIIYAQDVNISLLIHSYFASISFTISSYSSSSTLYKRRKNSLRIFPFFFPFLLNFKILRFFFQLFLFFHP